MTELKTYAVRIRSTADDVPPGNWNSYELRFGAKDEDEARALAEAAISHNLSEYVAQVEQIYP